MIGERLKRVRVAAVSMQVLGDKVGVSGNMIKKYEYDASMPSSTILLKLATTFSTDGKRVRGIILLQLQKINIPEH